MIMDYGLRIAKIEEKNRDEYKRAMALVNSLKRELANFDFDGNFDDLSLFIIKVSEILPRIKDNRLDNLNAEIVKLHKEVRSLIVNRPEHIEKTNPNFLELKTIIDNLEGMNISYMYNYIDQYDGNAYNLVRYLLFEEKNLYFVKYAMQKYPHFINARKNDKDCIILEVVDKYIEAIDKYTREGKLRFNNDLFFYDMVLENLLDSKKIFYSKDLELMSLKKVDEFLNNLDYSKYNGEVKAKLVFWCNELKDRLEKVKRKETLSHLSYKTDVTIDFHESVLSEARRFNPNNFKEEARRRSRTSDDFIITIDGERAEEIDDGLSVKRLENGNYLLGVHICDPTGYIDKHSILFDEAYKRTTAIYSSLGTMTMYPEQYAKNYMSLTQNKNRFCTSYYLEITKDGEILLDSCVFKKSIVNVNRRMNYDNFNLLARTGSEDRKLNETIEGLQEVRDCLSKRFIMDENYRIAHRGETNVSATNITGSSSGEKIVEFAMLAANTTVASYSAKNGIPFIYRGHQLDMDYLAKIDYFDKKFRENPTSENYEVFVNLLKNTYPKSFYTTDSHIGHVGIGVPHYAHITSPLRRFADVLATEALNIMYFNKVVSDKDVYMLEDRLKEGCRYINERKTAIDYFNNRCSKVKKKVK